MTEKLKIVQYLVKNDIFISANFKLLKDIINYKNYASILL